MPRCCLCENEHPHPRGRKATDAGWMVMEGKMESHGVKTEAVLVFCPDHDVETRWEKIKKEFPPSGGKSK